MKFTLVTLVVLLGLAQPAFADLDLVNIRYVFRDENPIAYVGWSHIKGKLDFPDIVYLQVGDYRETEIGGAYEVISTKNLSINPIAYLVLGNDGTRYIQPGLLTFFNYGRWHVKLYPLAYLGLNSKSTDLFLLDSANCRIRYELGQWQIGPTARIVKAEGEPWSINPGLGLEYHYPQGFVGLRHTRNILQLELARSFR